jgi:hypothetical protein
MGLIFIAGLGIKRLERIAWWIKLKCMMLIQAILTIKKITKLLTPYKVKNLKFTFRFMLLGYFGIFLEEGCSLLPWLC